MSLFWAGFLYTTNTISNFVQLWWLPETNSKAASNKKNYQDQALSRRTNINIKTKAKIRFGFCEKNNLCDIRIFTHDMSGPMFIPWSGIFLPRPLGNAQRREPPREMGWGRVCEYSSSFYIRNQSGINLEEKKYKLDPVGSTMHNEIIKLCTGSLYRTLWGYSSWYMMILASWWVSRGHLCCYILNKVVIWIGVLLTHWQTLKDTQFLIKCKGGALLTQYVHCSF